MKQLSTLYKTFPIQLFLLHFKKNKALLLWWLLLLGIITFTIAGGYGGGYLFLDPEYREQVSFWSFFWVGLGFGFFFMAWNIATYLTNAFRFPFLATLNAPLYSFCINNSLIPLSFLSIYFIALIRLQYYFEWQNITTIITYIAGFITGFLSLIAITAFYFHYTNKDIAAIIAHIKYRPLSKTRRGRKKRQSSQLSQLEQRLENSIVHRWEQIEHYATAIPISYYINTQFQIKLARPAEHYPEAVLQAVFRQHHINAFLIQLFSLIALLALSLQIDNPYLQIPAATSTFLVLSLAMTIVAAFSYWFTEWRTAVLVLMFLSIDYSTTYKWYQYDTPAYGLDYTKTPQPYNLATITQTHTAQQTKKDLQNTRQILEKWKKKAQQEQQKQKPTMVILHCSGGGHLANRWTFLAIQQADSILNRQLMPATFLISGASGGMIGATYAREYYYQQLTQKIPDWHNPKYAEQLSEDLFNPIAFTLAANDIFYPLQYAQIGKHKYIKNRAMAFENRLHQMTDSILYNKTLADYQPLEKNAIIPLIIFSPTITNDNRRLYISTQGVSYLINPPQKYPLDNPYNEPDGIDFQLYFKNHTPDQLRITSAIRMSATYPFVLPATVLPSQPKIQIMDAGFIDNFGFQTSQKFLSTFADWINQNTDQVIMIRIAGQEKIEQNQTYSPESITKQLIRPFAVFMSGNIQEYTADRTLIDLNQQLKGKIKFINFEYEPQKQAARASMSYHLTQREKQEIAATFHNKANQQNLQKLKNLLNTPNKSK